MTISMTTCAAGAVTLVLASYLVYDSFSGNT
ncbi:hypothetical protein WJX73_007837, partial [Symbiochloris irregularis]